MSNLSSNKIKKSFKCKIDVLKHNTPTLPTQIDIDIDDKKVTINMKNMDTITPLGQGSFSVVHLMRHTESDIKVAVKIFKDIEFVKEIMTDIEVGRLVTSPFKIHYYGAIQNCHSVWILMEPMELSLGDFYKKLISRNNNYRFPSSIIGYFAYCSVYGLEDLHVQKIIHRDVKPSNMLIDKNGCFKLCDFGISGKMKNSLTKSSVGTISYMAPERIDPNTCTEQYSIKSDVWSLGISIMEAAIMKFPYDDVESHMSQLNAIVKGPPPQLPDSSPYITDGNMIEFFQCTLDKNMKTRKKYDELKLIPFIDRYNQTAFNEAKEDLSRLVQS